MDWKSCGRRVILCFTLHGGLEIWWWQQNPAYRRYQVGWHVFLCNSDKWRHEERKGLENHPPWPMYPPPPLLPLPLIATKATIMAELVLYSLNHDQLYKHIIHIHRHMHAKTYWTHILEKYTSHFIWKGSVWEGVGDRTELQHTEPHSYSHQRFFPVLPGCSTGGRRPSLSGCWFTLPHLISNSSDP